MCGAGGLPARMADEARRRGWRVLAFAFADADVVAHHADRVIPARIGALAPAGAWTARAPSGAEWADIGRGFAVARMAADARIGQTVVVRHGVITAVEAVEGTSEAIRRGVAHGGPGAVIVKVVAQEHD